MSCRLAALLVVASTLSLQLALAQPEAPFALRSSDRVVLVGDGLIEQAQHHGWIEMALTTRWPAANVAFRNVGWAGDTVAGTARRHYTHPPTAYEHLLEQINAPDPTVIVFGYGGLPAYDGPADLTAFRAQYARLLTDAVVPGRRCVLLAPLPHDGRTSPRTDVDALNARLLDARDAVAAVAAEHGCWFVDLFGPMQAAFAAAAEPLTTNGLRLTSDGYAELARHIEHSLAGTPRATTLTLHMADAVPPRHTFIVTPPLLPAQPGVLRSIVIEGLPRGTYRLETEGVQLAGTAAAWADGLPALLPAEQARLAQLRDAIVRKNALYFRQYRPLNETYLVGFRRYEQGRHAADIGLLTPLIDDLENEIGRLRAPQPLRFRLARP